MVSSGDLEFASPMVSSSRPEKKRAEPTAPKSQINIWTLEKRICKIPFGIPCECFVRPENFLCKIPFGIPCECLYSVLWPETVPKKYDVRGEWRAWVEVTDKGKDVMLFQHVAGSARARATENTDAFRHPDDFDVFPQEGGPVRGASASAPASARAPAPASPAAPASPMIGEEL